MEGNKAIRTAIYIRLSKEDENKRNKSDLSESVKNQQLLCREYIKNSKENFKVYKEYIDDGVSGTSILGRKGILELIKDVENGKIDCVIIKKLDRLARSEADSIYLFNLFEKNDVRLISFGDGHDTNVSRHDIIVYFQSFMNADYSRKLSENVIRTFDIKRNNGEFIGAFASYGYKKDEKDKNHLVIDEPAAKIVKQIFDDFLHGKGQLSIAQDLNLHGIPCPSEYKKSQGLNYTNCNKKESTNFWTYSTVHNILKNKMYVGDMWQKRNNRSKFSHKKKLVAEEKQIIVKDTHEAIISRDDFDRVQNKLKNNRDISSSLKQNVSAYAGHIYCECGQVMSKITNKYKGVSNNRYVCRSYKMGMNTCSSHSVHEKDLDEAVLNFLNEMLKTVNNMKDAIKKAAKDKSKTQKDIEEKTKLLNAEIAKQTKRISRYQDLFADEGMTKEEYFNKKKACEKIIENSKNEISNLSKSIGKTEEEIFLANPIISTLLSVGKFEQVTKNTVDTFIKQIIVHEDEKGEKFLEIIPTFKI